MNTNITTPITTLEDLDVTELLDGIFASGVDLKDVMALGLTQIEASEKEAAQAAKTEAKATKKALRAVRRAENAGINTHLFRGGVNVAVGGLAAGVVVLTPGVNVALAGLALTQGARAVRQGFKAHQAKIVRDAVRNGETISITEEQALRALIGDARFETIFDLAEAGLMVQMGVAAGDPVFLVCAAIEVLAAGFTAMVWGAAGNALEAHLAIENDEVRPGAHKRPSMIAQVIAARVAVL